MDERWIDRLAKALRATADRRAVLGAIGAALAGAPLSGSRAGAAKDPARCRRDANSCKRRAANLCAKYYPGTFEGVCTQQLKACCAKVAKCQYGAANRCINQSGW